MSRLHVRLSSWRFWTLSWVLCLSVWYLFQNSHLLVHVTRTKLDHGKLIQLFAHLHQRNHDLQRIQTHLSVYDELYSQINMYDFLTRHTLRERCMLYFNHLAMSDPEWVINPNEPQHFDRQAFESFEVFRNRRIEEWENRSKEAEKEGKAQHPQPSDETIRKEFDEIRRNTLGHEQKMHDFVAHVRIFDKCFMEGQMLRWADQKHVLKQQFFLQTEIDYQYTPEEKVSVGRAYVNELECREIEGKVFPFLNNRYPEYQSWSGEKTFFPGDSKTKDTSICFLNDFKRRINGKGIVMTVGDGHVEDAARLIRVLRYFRNKYPIQVVYYKGLTQTSRRNLIKAARDEFQDLPPQDLWFVNVKRCVKGKYLLKFGGFANKILATMFNSFEDMLFLDADSVILKKPEYFFKLKKYVKTGTFFFKDRSLINGRGAEDHVFFQKLLPSVEDSIVFNIPQTSNYTMHNEFFRARTYHYMESGAVVLNRKKHFMMPFMMGVMNFYSLISSRIYGDKELFWLANAFLGDENYSFNDNFAAASGELTPLHERHKDVGKEMTFKSEEICTNHPSHISDEDNSLIWLNSGFRFCGSALKLRIDYPGEFGDKTRFLNMQTLEDFKTFYSLKLKITHAIIPPFYPDHARAANKEHEPETSWRMMRYCNGYCWCAYSLIGGEFEKDGKIENNRLEGKIIEFSQEEQDLFNKVADVWIAPLGFK